MAGRSPEAAPPPGTPSERAGSSQVGGKRVLSTGLSQALLSVSEGARSRRACFTHGTPQCGLLLPVQGQLGTRAAVSQLVSVSHHVGLWRVVWERCQGCLGAPIPPAAASVGNTYVQEAGVSGSTDRSPWAGQTGSRAPGPVGDARQRDGRRPAVQRAWQATCGGGDPRLCLGPAHLAAVPGGRAVLPGPLRGFPAQDSGVPVKPQNPGGRTQP